MWQWGSDRLDVITLEPFVKGVYPTPQVRGRSPIDDALELFWSQYHPLRERIDRPSWRPSRSPAERLSAEHERLMLECLEFLEKRHRVAYEPDVDDGRWQDELIVYLHVAAARAFRLKRIEGVSEEVQVCLTEVARTVMRLGGARVLAGNTDDNPAFFTSLSAASALSLVELSCARKDHGEYVDALHYLAEAAVCYDAAVTENEMPEESRYYYEDEDAEDLRVIESRLRSILKDHLTGLQVSLEEAKTIFELIGASAPSIKDWTQVAQDCKTLAYAWNVSGVEDETKEEFGGTLTWSEYWHSAHAWASAQFSPSEYRKMREADEKDAAERRLKSYFFGDDWSALPENAQRRLISADVNWNSPQRMSREAILNDLLRATEEMCYEFIWQPLSRSKSAYEEFQPYEDRVAKRQLGSYPSVRDYVGVCEDDRFFPDFCTSRGLGQNDEEFMVESLPIALRQLVDHRNRAEHETGSSTPREVITDCYRTFLGIGKRGVLPELARIGLELRGKRRRMG